MRKNFVVALAGLGLMAAIAARPAAAFPATHCSTGALKVCAAVDATTYFQSATGAGHGWHLVMNVWNLFDGTAANGLSNVITFAGMGNASFSGTASLFSATYNDGAVSWVNQTTWNSNPVGAEINFAAAGTQGINHGLIGCTETIHNSQLQTCYHTLAKALVLDFSTSAEFNLADQSTMYGWHAQSIGNTGCSLWVGSDGTETSPANPDGSACGNVVPEPVTMALLGTGLLGVGGVGLVRRRKKNGDVTNA